MVTRFLAVALFCVLSAEATCQSPLNARFPFCANTNWTGTYFCNQGFTYLTLEIKTANKTTGHVHAGFDFYGNGVGLYLIDGTFNSTSSSMTMVPGAWLYNPNNYISTQITGQVRVSGNIATYKGTLSYYLCTTFALNFGADITFAYPPPSGNQVAISVRTLQAFNIQWTTNGITARTLVLRLITSSGQTFVITQVQNTGSASVTLPVSIPSTNAYLSLLDNSTAAEIEGQSAMISINPAQYIIVLSPTASTNVKRGDVLSIMYQSNGLSSQDIQLTLVSVGALTLTNTALSDGGYVVSVYNWTVHDQSDLTTGNPITVTPGQYYIDFVNPSVTIKSPTFNILPSPCESMDAKDCPACQAAGCGYATGDACVPLSFCGVELNCHALNECPWAGPNSGWWGWVLGFPAAMIAVALVLCFWKMERDRKEKQAAASQGQMANQVSINAQQPMVQQQVIVQQPQQIMQQQYQPMAMQQQQMQQQQQPMLQMQMHHGSVMGYQPQMQPVYQQQQQPQMQQMQQMGQQQQQQPGPLPQYPPPPVYQ